MTSVAANIGAGRPGAGRQALAAYAVVLVLTAAPAVAQQAQQQAKKPGEVEVTVKVSDGKSLKSAKIYAKSEEAEVSDAGKAVKISKVPAGRVAVTVEAQISMGFFKGSKRYLGVADTIVPENGLQKVEVTVAPVETIDAFCSGCHPSGLDPGYKPQPGVIVRDVHASGREFPERTRETYFSEIKAYNDRIARLEREGKPHNLPMPLEERVVVVAGKEVKKTFFTCESCHTLHRQTPGGKYARAPFREKSDLCRICHF